MNQHDCCLCEIENCAVCALYPVCVGCKENDDGGRLDGFDISVLNLHIIDCNGVLQEHGWVCGGCAFIENQNDFLEAMGGAVDGKALLPLVEMCRAELEVEWGGAVDIVYKK